MKQSFTRSRVQGIGPRDRIIGTITDHRTRFISSETKPNRWNESIPYKNKYTLDHVLNTRTKTKTKIKAQDSMRSEFYPSKFINFYDPLTLSPYVPKTAKGPWILTEDLKLVYDAGGYGMLGFGHNDDEILEILGKPQVMANILTHNYSQNKFSEAFDNHAPLYQGIMALNSGSETNELAFRIADVYFKKHHSDKEPVIVILEGSFHGRTYLSGQASASCNDNFKKYLFTYNRFFKTHRLRLNDTDNVKQVFEMMRKIGQAPLLTLIEPVMGEGNPGSMVTPEFYHAIRSETKRMNCLLHVDSVQAGIRCTGSLSLTTYNGFNIDKDSMPDMEVFSKALNGGQFPLSILGLKDRANYQIGIYGNTMTGNPRALDVGTSILNRLDDGLKSNIQRMGYILKQRMGDLCTEYPGIIDHVTGTGLLVAVHLNEKYDMYDVEQKVRIRGLNVIHGGKNALRVTPWFMIDEREIEYIHGVIGSVLKDL